MIFLAFIWYSTHVGDVELFWITQNVYHKMCNIFCAKCDGCLVALS